MADKNQHKKVSALPRGTTRPGGRTERVRKAVLAAVLARLEAGELQFSFQDIATAAGVHVATIYARWADRQALIAEAYGEHVRRLDIAFSGDWQADLRNIGFVLRDFLNDPVEVAANRLLITSGDSDYRTQMERNFSSVITELAVPLLKARQAGFVRPDADPEIVIGMLISSLLARIMFTSQTPDDPTVDTLVDHLIAACRA